MPRPLFVLSCHSEMSRPDEARSVSLPTTDSTVSDISLSFFEETLLAGCKPFSKASKVDWLLCRRPARLARLSVY